MRKHKYHILRKISQDNNGHYSQYCGIRFDYPEVGDIVASANWNSESGSLHELFEGVNGFLESGGYWGRRANVSGELWMALGADTVVSWPEAIGAQKKFCKAPEAEVLAISENLEDLLPYFEINDGHTAHCWLENIDKDWDGPEKQNLERLAICWSLEFADRIKQNDKNTNKKER